MTACCDARVNGCHGRIRSPCGEKVLFDLSTARWLASRKPAVTWFELPADGSTSLRTATSAPSFAEGSSPYTVALTRPVSSTSLSSGGVVYVSAVASQLELSVSHGPLVRPAVHCTVMREQGDDAGSSGVVSRPGFAALAAPSLPSASR